MEWTMLFGLSGHLFHCVWHTTTCPHTIKAAVPQLVLYPMFLLWRNSPGELTWLDVVVKLWSFRDAAVATSGLVFVLALTPLGKLLSSIKELRLVLMFGLDFAIQTFL